MAGSSTVELPVPPAERVFYFDFSSPASWLAAERVLQVVEQPCEWMPVALPFDPAFRCAEEEASFREDVERAALAQGLPAVRWPKEFPFDSALAQRAATFAKGGGKTVGFALAAFRQAFNGGRSLADPDTVLIAGAAVELHPRALLIGADTNATKKRLERATAEALERGITETPALWDRGVVRDVPSLSAGAASPSR
jgi:2-hydroxychromene-2-carboxylate isomerase